MKKFSLVAILIVAGFTGSNVFAQECGIYARADRSYVQGIFLQVSPVLNRLHEIAVQSNQYELAPQTQRAAMNAEYQYLADYLTQLGDSTHPVKRKTKLFLNSTVDRDYLGLTGTTVDGITVEEAEANTYDAIRKSFSALAKLWSCY